MKVYRGILYFLEVVQMNNTNVLKPGDRCFFDVFGESDIYDTYIVTVVKKLQRKDLCATS